MPVARVLRPNIFVLLVIIGVLLLLGIDRFIEIAAPTQCGGASV